MKELIRERIFEMKKEHEGKRYCEPKYVVLNDYDIIDLRKELQELAGDQISFEELKEVYEMKILCRKDVLFFNSKEERLTRLAEIMCGWDIDKMGAFFDGARKVLIDIKE